MTGNNREPQDETGEPDSSREAALGISDIQKMDREKVHALPARGRMMPESSSAQSDSVAESHGANAGETPDNFAESPHRNRTIHRRRILRRVAQATGTLAALAGIIGLVFTVMDRFAPQSSPLAPSNVKVVSVGVNRLQDVDLNVNYADIEFSQDKGQASAIDVVLQNVGGTTASIRSIRAHFDHAMMLENCNPGRGPVKVTGVYDIKVPIKLTSQTFDKYRQNVFFEVRPNRLDRLAVTVGPEIVYSGDVPWVYDANLYLTLDNTQGEIETQHVKFLSPASDIAPLLKEIAQNDPRELPCVQRNIAHLSSVDAMAGQSSPQLTELLEAYTSELHRLKG